MSMDKGSQIAFFKNLCKKYKVPPDLIDWEAAVDSTLGFDENYSIIIEEIRKIAPADIRIEIESALYEGRGRESEYKFIETNLLDFQKAKPLRDNKRFKSDYLNILKSARRIKRFLTFDIESEKWKDFKLCGFYDGKEYQKFDDIDDTVDFILNPKHRNVLQFAHFMGKFDGMFILDNLFFHRTGYTVTPIVNAGRILEIKIKDKHGNVWKIRDSYSLLPSSLYNLTHNFNVEHKKFKETEKGMLDNPEYNKYDCMGLYEVLQKFFEANDYQVGLTLSQTAMTRYRTSYQQKPIRCVREHEDIIRNAYFGGRVEIYRYNFDMAKDFYIYDMNSLYPFCLREFEYPYGEFNFCSPDISKEGFSYATVVDDPYFPFFPQRIEKKMMFLKGKKTGWHTNQELRYYENIALDKSDVEVHKTLACEQSDHIFRGFIDDYYKKRMEAKSSGNKVLDYACKIIMNSFYGKFAQRRDKSTTILNPEYIEDGMLAEMIGYNNFIYKKVDYNDSSHIIPSIAAFVTAYARMHMHKAMMRCDPKGIYYQDTDSLIVDHPYFEHSTALGHMKLEDKINNFKVLLPKVYSYTTDEGKHEYRAKGLHLNTALGYEKIDEIFNRYIAGDTIYNEDGIETFVRSLKMARKKGLDTILFNKSHSKSMVGYYDKRRIEPCDLDGGYICPPFLVDEKRDNNAQFFRDVKDRYMTILNSVRT